MKAFLLTAGLGSRLHPLTSLLPKPLLPCLGVPLIRIILAHLRKHGFTDIAYNTHHLPHKFLSVPELATCKNFHERKLLGTAGFIRQITEWARNEAFLIYNGDILSDIDLRKLWQTHHKKNADVTLALLPRSLPQQTQFYTSSDHIVACSNALKREQGKSFACAQIWSPRFCRLVITEKITHTLHAYQTALAKGYHLAYQLHHGLWHDLGTGRDFFLAHLALSKCLREDRDYLGIHHLTAEALDSTCTIVGSPNIDSASKLTQPLFLTSSNITLEKATLRHCVVMQGSRVSGEYSNCLFLGEKRLHFDKITREEGKLPTLQDYAEPS